MHDDMIISYNMDFKSKKLEIYTHNELYNTKSTIVFFNVLTHSFDGILEFNQILDIDEWSIESFIKENKEHLEMMKGYCWPINYHNYQNLKDYLAKNEYKYVKVISAYGMFGWVLAKNYQII